MSIVIGHYVQGIVAVRSGKILSVLDVVKAMIFAHTKPTVFDL